MKHQNKKNKSTFPKRMFHVSRFTFHDKGFTLLESLVAIAVFTVGITAAITLILSSLNVGTRTRDKIIAANLAQEGLEVVRNIRDNNWFSGQAWTTNIANTVSPYTLVGCMQWNGANLDAACVSNNLVFSSGRYIYSAAVSDFSRTVSTQYFPADTPNSGDPEKIKVSSVVTCGANCSIVLEEYLYNWR